MIWDTVSSWPFFAECKSFPTVGCKEYNQCDFGIDHLVMSMCRVVSCVTPRNFSYWKESSRTDNKFSNLWRQKRDSEPPGNLTLKASGTWLQNFSSTGETDSSRAQTQPFAHQGPGERSRVQKETEPDFPVSVQESVMEAWVDSGLLRGQGHLIQQPGPKSFWRRSLSSLPPP